MNLNIFLFILFFATAGRSQNLEDDNVCYLGIKPKLNNLTDLYKNPPSFTTTVPNFPDLESLIDEVENIILSTKNLENELNKTQPLENMDDQAKDVGNLKTALDILKSIMKEMGELNQKKDVHNKAFDTCSEANDLSDKLRKDVTDIASIGDAIRAKIAEASRRKDDINNKSMQTKNDLDAITIPLSQFEQYVCDLNLQSNIQDIIDTMRNIADILRRGFKEIIQEKLRDTKNSIDKTGKDIGDMKESLQEEIPKTDIKVTDETRATVEDLKKQLENLKNKLKNMNLDQSSDELLKNVEEKLKKLVNEYETFLKHIFSKENMDKAREELETARKTLAILKNRDDLKAELDEVKRIVNRLKEGGVCAREKVPVEE